MSKYSELVTKINELTKEAEKARKEEFSSVLKEIKRLIGQYGITPEDLGFTQASRVASRKGIRKASRPRPEARPKKKVPAKYRDAFGNTWTGRGKKPKWVVRALEAGISLESLAITAGTLVA